MLTHYFSRKGYEIRSAENGLEAMEREMLEDTFGYQNPAQQQQEQEQQEEEDLDNV